MEHFSKNQSSKKSSSKSDSPKKNDELSINILPQKIQSQSTTNIKRTKEDEPYNPQQKLTKVKSLENLPKYTKGTLSKDTNQNTIDPTVSKNKETTTKRPRRVLSLSKSDSLINSTTKPSTNSPRSAINSTIKPFFSKSPKVFEVKQPKIITAVRNNNYQAFKKIMEKQFYDINESNQFGMTALHYAVLEAINNNNSEIVKLNKKIITLFCQDPRTDTSKKNMSLFTASQLIPANVCPEIRKMLFARLTLDTLAWHETFRMLMSLQINNKQTNDADINKTVDCIINKIKKTQSLQGGTEIPEDALLPDYMTDKFIANIIKYRIKQQPEETNFLISNLHPEIEVLLFNMKIDDFMIIQARENVKTIILKQDKIPLPEYASDVFFIKVIESYIQGAKTNFKPCLEIFNTESSEKDIFNVTQAEIKK
jgi:hypothetical protein